MSKQEMTYVQHLYNINTDDTGLCDHEKEGKQLWPRRRGKSRCLKIIKCLVMCVVGLLCSPNGCYLNDYGTICCSDSGPGAPPALYDKFHNYTRALESTPNTRLLRVCRPKIGIGALINIGIVVFLRPCTLVSMGTTLYMASLANILKVG